MQKLAQYNKTLVSVLGLIVLVGADVANNNAGLLPADWANTLTIALGALTAFLTFWVRNEPVLEAIVTDVEHPTAGSVVEAASKASVFVGEAKHVLDRIEHPKGVDLTPAKPSPVPRDPSSGTYPEGPYVAPTYTGPIPPVTPPPTT